MVRARQPDRGARGDGRHGSDWLLGKSHPTFAPMGPFVVPHEFVPDPQKMPIKFTLSGKVMQDSNTDRMTHNIYELVSYASHIITLQPGDVIVDGGNANFNDSMRRAKSLADRGIGFVDAGVSGGVWGLENGYCLMVGGDDDDVARLRPVFEALAPPDGFAHIGSSGTGHFVKMIHNGIEYGMMQAYAEGFELLGASDYGLDLPAVARVWNHGSVVRSWLLELTADVLAANPKLEGIRPWVEDSGEGRWTVEDAVAKAVPAPAITAALFARFRSRREQSFAEISDTTADRHSHEEVQRSHTCGAGGKHEDLERNWRGQDRRNCYSEKSVLAEDREGPLHMALFHPFAHEGLPPAIGERIEHVASEDRADRRQRRVPEEALRVLRHQDDDQDVGDFGK